MLPGKNKPWPASGFPLLHVDPLERRKQPRGKKSSKKGPVKGNRLVGYRGDWGEMGSVCPRALLGKWGNKLLAHLEGRKLWMQWHRLELNISVTRLQADQHRPGSSVKGSLIKQQVGPPTLGTWGHSAKCSAKCLAQGAKTPPLTKVNKSVQQTIFYPREKRQK